MRQTMLLAILVCLALGTASCYYVQPSCAPLAARPYYIHPAPVVVPAYAPPRCPPHTLPGYATPYHLPYTYRTMNWNPTLPLHHHCRPYYYVR